MITGNVCYDDQTPKTQEYGVYEGATTSNCSIIANNVTGNGTAGIYRTSATTIVEKNNGYIGKGEVRGAAGALAAGNANAFAFAWQNPETQSVIVTEITIDITTAGGTAGAVIDVGSGATGTTASNNLIDDGDLNTIGVLVSDNRVTLAENGGAVDYITGQILVQNAASLAGNYYIKYVGAS